MKAASPSVQAQPGTTQQPTRVGSAASSGQQPSPHSSIPGHASSGATARPSADVMHSHPDDYPSGSNTAGTTAALSSQQCCKQNHQAQTGDGTSLLMPSTQEGQVRTADSMPGSTDAAGAIYGAGGLLHGAGGAVHGVRGPVRGTEEAMLDAERAMHDDLWTQAGSIVEYPAAYRLQVRLHCDRAVCPGETGGLLVRRPADVFVTGYLKPTVAVLSSSSWCT